MDERVGQVRDALRAAKHITLNPCASEAAVIAFEARVGVALPVAYRAFVLEVGDGIAIDGEPWLYPLDIVLGELARDRTDASKPFAYDDREADAIRAAIVAVPTGGSILGDVGVMSLQKRGQPDGCLTIATSGGNDFSVLVVTGAQAGAMWRTGELDAPEWRALYVGGSDFGALDFLDWLPLWAQVTLGVAF